MTDLKSRIQKRTEEIIAFQKKQGWHNFKPELSTEIKNSLESDLKTIALVDATIEEIEKIEARLAGLEARQNGASS